MDASNLLKRPSPRRHPLHRLDDLQEYRNISRRPGARPPLPEDRRQRADDRGSIKSARLSPIRAASQGSLHREAIKRRSLSHRYIGDRKLPTSDRRDDRPGAQMLVPKTRRKTITAREVEACVATMARIRKERVGTTARC